MMYALRIKTNGEWGAAQAFPSYAAAERAIPRKYEALMIAAEAVSVKQGFMPELRTAIVRFASLDGTEKPADFWAPSKEPPPYRAARAAQYQVAA